MNDTSTTQPIYQSVRGALLGTRFQSLDELRSVIKIEYINDNTADDSIIHDNSKVIIKHCSNGKEITAILSSGTSQNDISKAQLGNLMELL